MKQQFKSNLFSFAGLVVFLFLALGSLPSMNKDSNTKPTPPPRPANTTKYTNSRAQFTGKLATNYVDFSFDYPNGWVRKEAGKGTDPNFVKVENATSDNFTIENFTVGYFSGPKELMPQLAQQMSAQFARSLPEYEKVSEGETKVGPYDGYEIRFSSHLAQSARGPIDFWGRCILLSAGTNTKGVALVMLASSAGTEVKGPEDIGEKGELAIILNSFAFSD